MFLLTRHSISNKRIFLLDGLLGSPDYPGASNSVLEKFCDLSIRRHKECFLIVVGHVNLNCLHEVFHKAVQFHLIFLLISNQR
jgi:hypothetical protein